MIANDSKTHKGALPSPVAGMSMGDWLSHARTVEHELESILKREDLTHPQREKFGALLLTVRSYLIRQLDRLNGPVAKVASKS